MSFLSLCLFILLTYTPDEKADKLLEAATKGDTATVKQLIEAGVDVNSKNDYGATALTLACDKGHLEIVKFLIEKKADLNVTDTFYRATPIVWATMRDRRDILVELTKAGASGVSALNHAITKNDAKMVDALIKTGKFDKEKLETALKSIAAEKTEIIELLIKAGASAELKPKPTEKKDPTPAKPSTPPTKMDAAEKVEKTAAEVKGKVEKPLNWPCFRGKNASGVADGQFPPLRWDATKGENLIWKTPIPGLGLSCPVVWGDRVYITTAVGEADAKLKIGQYGDVDSVQDSSPHQWKLYALEKKTGKVLWEKTAYTGVPQMKRHTKSSHANCTPAINGEYIAVCFGSEGLFCYSPAGELLWKKDLGKLSSGWFYDNAYEWGFGSSPVIYKETVIVQCDIGKGSFIAAFDLKTGSQKWMTERDEIPSWGSPSIVEPENGPAELVTNSTKFARSYDPETGKELWRIGKNSEITVPTPFLSKGMIFITSGYRPIQPIYAIKPGSKGDLSLATDKESSDQVVWSKKRGGPYMPTPIAYGEHLYVCSNNGIIGCYELATGKEVYNKRLSGINGYTASPVAAEGRIYFTGEDGTVRVIEAGKDFKLLAVNPLGEDCLSTPAISDGLFIVRARNHVFALGLK